MCIADKISTRSLEGSFSDRQQGDVLSRKHFKLYLVVLFIFKRSMSKRNVPVDNFHAQQKKQYKLIRYHNKYQISLYCLFYYSYILYYLNYGSLSLSLSLSTASTVLQFMFFSLFCFLTLFFSKLYYHYCNFLSIYFHNLYTLI